MDEVKSEEIKVTGKYKPSKRLISFVSGTNHNLRLLSDFAFIKGDKLSGMLENTKFKITLYKDGTIDFDEIDTHLSTEDMVERLIEDICQSEVTGYVGKYVVGNLEFFNDDVKRCYLEIEHKKPVAQLADLLDGDNDYEKEEEEVTTKETKTRKKSDKKDTPVFNQMIEDSVDEMKKNKIEELKTRVGKTERDIINIQNTISTSKSKLDEYNKNLKVLNSRLESFAVKDEPNGYVYFVSEEQKSGLTPDEATIKVIEKISPLLGLNSEALTDLLTKGFYVIKISKKSEISEEKKTIDKEILEKLLMIDVNGSFKMVSENEIEYRGDIKYNELVTKLEYKGFEKDPDFDKLCGSNSYENKGMKL